MRTIFNSLIGTLTAALILACTAGASLYVCHRMDIAIGDAVARQFAEMQPNDAVLGVAADASAIAQGTCGPSAEASPQSVAAAFVDSKVVAVLIEELSGASPEEREVWTNLLRSPTSAGPVRNLFAHYHGKAPTHLQQTSGHVQVTCAEAPQEISPPCSCEAPQHVSLTGSCRRVETSTPEYSSTEMNSAIDALQAAEQLLMKSVHENFLELLQLREDLLKQRQEAKGEAAQSGDWPDHED